MIWAFDVDQRSAMTSPAGSPPRRSQRELLLRPIGRTVYWMPPYCLTEDEMELLASRTLEIVACA